MNSRWSFLHALCLSSVCLLAPIAHGREALQTTIKKLEVEHENGTKVIVHVAANVSPTLGCATQSPSFDNAFVFDTAGTTALPEIGKNALALLTAALLAGRVVDIAGTGDCTTVNLGGVIRSVEVMSFYSVN